MLRVSKVDEWLPRPRDAERPQESPRAHGDCVIIRPGGRLPVAPPAAPSQPGAGARMRAHLAILPPGTRGRPHFHAAQATAIHVVSGETEVWHGDGLAQRWVARAGDVVCVPPGAPHLAVNRGDVTAIAVLTLTDQPDQAGTVVIELPRHLAGLLGLPVAAGP
ncbi:MAG TPA: cupin domain-containing protein [Trebonia sp.]|nr:cupin domain-containing protein [Trebonia sp.]